jgi:DNA-binding MarR family transcriptional regulator
MSRSIGTFSIETKLSRHHASLSIWFRNATISLMGRSNPTSSKVAVADLVTQLGRYASGEASAAGGLTSAQWTALRYFSRANRFSRTVSVFAEFHATTRGTASQTVKGLVDQGYLERTLSPSDGRSSRLDVTPKAVGILTDDPFHLLTRAADSLSATAQHTVMRALDRMLGQLARELRKPAFGTCKHCKHLYGGDCCPQGQSPYRCTVLNEPLAEPEVEQLCVNFESS